MDEEVERLVISVRADTAAFARDVSAMRAELEGPLVHGGGQEIEARMVSARALLGTASTVLPSGQPSALDLVNSVDVELVNGERWLESCDDEALSNGANLAIVGSELVQFGSALPLAPGRFRLSRLLRGRRGSEWAMGLHRTGEPFVLLARSRLHRLHLSGRHCGASVRVRPIGLADSPSQEVNAIVSGEAMRPPPPVHLRAWVTPDGALRCTWTRRSRHGWPWLDNVDAPLGCATERYRITLRGPEAAIAIETDTPEAEFASLGIAQFAGDDVEISVVQIGDLAISRPTSLTIRIS